MAAKTSDPIDILLEMGIDLDNLSEEEDYLSALMEAANTLTIKDATDPRIAPLQQEILKLRKKRFAKARPKAKKTTIKPDTFFDKKKPEEKTESTPGQKALPGQQTAAIVKRQTISPEVFKKSEEPEQEEKKKRKAKKSDPLRDILKSVNSILATLKNQNKLTKKQAERDRKDAEKARRGAQEDELETSPMKKFFAGAKKLAKPAISFFESIMKFIVTVLIGRLLVKILDWMGDKKNKKKMDAIMDFFKVTWPAFLAAFLAFQFGLGGFITGLLGLIGGFIPKLLGLIPKMLAGLGKLATGNPLLVAAAAGAALFAMGKIIPEVAPQTVETETDKKVDENIEKKGGEQTATDLAEEQVNKKGERNAFQNFFFGTIMGEDAEYEKQKKRAKTGEEPEYGKKFNKGGIVPGSGPNKDTVPAMLTPGEFVMSRGAVQTYGTDTLASMNAMGGGTNMPSLSFNGGGVVPGYNGGGHVHAGPDMEPEVELEGPAESEQNKEAGKTDKDKDALTETLVVPKEPSIRQSPGALIMQGKFGEGFKKLLFGRSEPPDSAINKPENQSESGDGDGEEEEIPLTLAEPAKSLIGNDTEFLAKVDEVSQKIGANPADLLGLMASESGLNPHAVNSSSGATGLIQFIPSTAASLGTSVGALRGMNRAQQMEYVEKFLLKTAPPNPTPGHLYTSVFLPAFAKKPADYVIAKKGGFTSDWGYHRPSWYTGNAGLDMNRDGSIQIEELGKRIKDKQQAYGIGGGSAVKVSSVDSSGDLSSPSGGGPGPGPGGDTQPPSAQIKPAGPSKPLPPPSRGQKLSDLYAQQEARSGRGSSSGASGESPNPGALNTPNSNDLPPIDANGMISMEKIKVLGITVV
jgi:hypothetical protein